MGRLFGTDGVRGVANSELTPELAFNLGKAGAFVLSKNEDKPVVLIGKDTRISGDMLEDALSAGILAMGGDVIKVGVLPTPAIAGLNSALKWTLEHQSDNAKRMTSMFIYTLGVLSKIYGLTLYTNAEFGGPNIAFNVNGMSSTDAGNILSDEYDICVRTGLHCAPLAHKHYGTLSSGMIRASLGVDTKLEEINFFIQAVKELAR